MTTTTTDHNYPQQQQPQQDTTLLWTYYRSSCSWRVRIALHLKQVPYTNIAVNLLLDHHDIINPCQSVPSLRINGLLIHQSLAIIEYLDEKYPNDFHLLGQDLETKTKIRSLAFIIACDTQPIQNLRVLKYYSDEHPKRQSWGKHWIDTGLTAYEKLVAQYMGQYSVGDHVTLADICLVPQVYNANRFEVDMSKFPNIMRIHSNLVRLEPFILAHPDVQPDCPTFNK